MDENNIIIKLISLIIIAALLVWGMVILQPTKLLDALLWGLLVLMAFYGWQCLFQLWLYDKDGKVLERKMKDGIK